MDQKIKEEYRRLFIEKRKNDQLFNPMGGSLSLESGLQAIKGNSDIFHYGGLVYYPPTTIDDITRGLDVPLPEEYNSFKKFAFRPLNYTDSMKEISPKTGKKVRGIIEHFCDSKGTTEKKVVYMYHSFDFLVPYMMHREYGHKLPNKEDFPSYNQQVNQLFNFLGSFDENFKTLKKTHPKLGLMKHYNKCRDRVSDFAILLAMDCYEFAAINEFAMSSFCLSVVAGLQDGNFYFLRPPGVPEPESKRSR